MLAPLTCSDDVAPVAVTLADDDGGVWAVRVHFGDRHEALAAAALRCICGDGGIELLPDGMVQGLLGVGRFGGGGGGGGEHGEGGVRVEGKMM